MRVFGLSDLHLSSTGEKPMDVFGPEWAGHQEKVAENWRRTVSADDVVLLCGDLSWAMHLAQAEADLAFIDALPGQKYFIRGNHDYWFAGPSKVRSTAGASMHLIRFDAAVHGGVGICGVRGWTYPGHPDFTPDEDEKHWRRSVARLDLSLKALKALDWDVAVAMFHFPPRSAARDSELTRMVRDAGVRYCVYGHVHGRDAQATVQGEQDGVVYRCVSVDGVGFSPAFLFER